MNRGWVPRELKERAARPESLTEGMITLTGLPRPSEHVCCRVAGVVLYGDVLPLQPSRFVPSNRPEDNVWLTLSLDELAQWHDALPILVDADEASSGPGGVPLGGLTGQHLTNNHLEYVFTWYGLAAAMMVFLRHAPK